MPEIKTFLNWKERMTKKLEEKMRKYDEKNNVILQKICNMVDQVKRNGETKRGVFQRRGSTRKI